MINWSKPINCKVDKIIWTQGPLFPELSTASHSCSTQIVPIISSVTCLSVQDQRGQNRQDKTQEETKTDCSTYLFTKPINKTIVFYFPPQFQLCACRELQSSITERQLQSERLVFQEEALSALHNLLTQDLQRYQAETQRLTCFTQKILKQSHRYQTQQN